MMNGDKHDRVRATALAAGAHMTEILEMFKPGARIAVAVWYPGKPDQDFLLLHPEAELQELIDTLIRRRDATNNITGRAGGG